MRLGLQMHSINQIVETKGFSYAMKAVKEIGYEGIEFAMHGLPTVEALTGIPGKELKKIMDDVGLVAIGHHLPPAERIMANLDAILSEMEALEVQYCGVGPAFYGDRSTFEEQKAIYEEYRKVFQIMKDHGVQPVVHGSAMGYIRDYKGRYVIDGMIEECGIDLLQPEFDTAWTIVGGEDPVKEIVRYSGKQDLLHLKDFHPPMVDSEYIMVRHNCIPRSQGAAVGDNGVLDLKPVVEAAMEHGVKWAITELWNEGDSLAQAKLSLENIRKYM